MDNDKGRKLLPHIPSRDAREPALLRSIPTKKRHGRKTRVESFRVARRSGVGDAHHHEKVEVAGCHVARFEHFLGSAPFSGALNVAVPDPTDRRRVELRIQEAPFELLRPADLKREVAAHNDRNPQIRQAT